MSYCVTSGTLNSTDSLNLPHAGVQNVTFHVSEVAPRRSVCGPDEMITFSDNYSSETMLGCRQHLLRSLGLHRPVPTGEVTHTCEQAHPMTHAANTNRLRRDNLGDFIHPEVLTVGMIQKWRERELLIITTVAPPSPRFSRILESHGKVMEFFK